MRLSRLLPLLVSVATTLNATTYYVSPRGDDSNPGTSPSAPWRTLSQATSNQYTIPYQAGDRILFEGGATFTGQRYLQADIWLGTAADSIGGRWHDQSR